MFVGKFFRKNFAQYRGNAYPRILRLLLYFIAGLNVSHDVIKNESRGDHIYDVVIIGAGFSGVGVASALHENDVKNFLVLEAKSQIGGRVYGIDFGGVQVPLGAGWIHKVDEDNLIWRMVQQYNIEFHRDDYDDLTYRDLEPDPTRKSAQDFLKKSKELETYLEKVTQDMTQLPRDMSLHYALKNAGWSAKSNLERAVEYLMIDFENGSPAETLSAQNFPVTGEGEDVIVTDKRGYEYVLAVKVKEFRAKIKTDKPVTEVERDGELYKLTTSDGDAYFARRVVCSASNQVILNDGIKFIPALPEWKMRAMRSVITGHYCKIFVEFPRQFWEDTNYIMIGKSGKEFLHWQNFKRVFPTKNVLQATLTGEECRRSQLSSNTQVTRELMHVLRTVYGSHIPSPINVLRSNWTFDPYTRGSYSLATVGTTAQHFEQMKEPVHGLWFTGEHTAGFKRMGFAGGALEAGLDLGIEIARVIRAEATRTLPLFTSKL